MTNTKHCISFGPRFLYLCSILLLQVMPALAAARCRQAGFD